MYLFPLLVLLVAASNASLYGEGGGAETDGGLDRVLSAESRSDSKRQDDIATILLKNMRFRDLPVPRSDAATRLKSQGRVAVAKRSSRLRWLLGRLRQHEISHDSKRGDVSLRDLAHFLNELDGGDSPRLQSLRFGR